MSRRNGVAPVISLDAKKYKLVQQLDAAMTTGTPSLIGCDRLTVTGDVHMAGDTVFKVTCFEHRFPRHVLKVLESQL